MSARRRGWTNAATAQQSRTRMPPGRTGERRISSPVARASSPCFRPDMGWKPMPQSRRRGRQDLLVLALVLRLAQLRGEDQQVVVHLGLRERLADLGDELALLEVAVQELELLEVLGGGLADEVPAGALLAVLLEPLLDDLVSGLPLFLVLGQLGRVESLVHVRQRLAEGRLAGQDLDVLVRQPPGPLQRGRGPAVFVRRGALAADEIEAERLALPE